MKINRSALLAAALLLPGVLMAWSSYHTDGLNSTTNWIVNGSGSVNNPGYRNTSSGTSGSLISSIAIPINSPNVDVGASFQLTPTGDSGRYVVYARASNDALYGPTLAGSYYALVAEANMTGSNGCNGVLRLVKRVGGVLQDLWVGTAVCFNNTFSIELVVRGSQLSVFNYGRHQVVINDSSLSTGQPGVGGWNMPSTSAITYTTLDHVETVAPLTPPATAVSVSSSATRVDFQFAGNTDDGAGKGIAYYELRRAPYGTGSWTTLGEIPLFFGQFTDNGVTAGTAYTYQIVSWDFHLNSSTLQFDVTVPPSGSLDIRRTGAKPNDPTFGSLGANVNLISGNVNYNLPLISAKARGGWGVTFSLNHDTQTWKKEGSKIWKYANDVGYGWRVLAGTVTRYFTNGQVSMVIFTDSTGTQYRLDRKVNSDGSTAGSYTGYWAASSDNFHGIFEDDWLSYRLRFPDGSFWDFGSRAAGFEGDYGAAFPTLFQDANGNQIKVSYNAGSGLGYGNSSGRIDKIEDARAPWASHTYAFNYSGFQLSSITNTIYTNEAYTFGYSTNDLIEPFSSTLWSGASAQKFLTSVNVTNLGSYAYAFDYGASGSYRTGELLKVTFPQGGYLRWNLGTWNYSASRSQREITDWVHKSLPAGSESSYPVTHETAGTTGNIHVHTTITEPSGSAYKRWDFNASALTTQYRVYASGGTEKFRVDSGWTTDSYGKPYINVTTTTYDPGQPYAKFKRTEQALDNFGNMTQMKLFDWGLTSGTPRRLYTNTYLATGTYSSFTGGNVYIKNRLLSSTYSENGATAITLVQNEYDNYAPGCYSGAGYSCAITATSGAQQKDTAYTTSFTKRGNLTSTSKYGDGSNPLPAMANTWTWLWYDDTGNVVRSKTPGGVIGTSVPDSGKNYAVPSSITVAGITNYMSWNSALNITGTSGPNSTSTSTSYGGTDFRPASKTNATGTTTTFAYTTTTTTATTNGRWVRSTVDGFGRPIKEEQGSGGTVLSAVDTQYEPCACTPIGKMKRVSRPYTGSPSAWTNHNYDALGRTVSVVAPDGSSTTSYLYEGNTVKVTDAAGKWKKFEQDAVGNLVQVNEPNPAGGADYVTTYTYDNFDRLTGVNMPRPTGTQTRSFTHGGFGVVSKTEPETGTTTYGYRTDGQISWKQDAKGQRVEYKYEDELILPVPQTKRLLEVRKIISGTEDLCQRVEYFYDGNYPPEGDAGISSYVSGRVSAVKYKTRNYGTGCSQTFVEQYSYKNYGAMVTKRLKMVRGSASGVLLSTADYDSEGRPTNTVYPAVSGTPARTVAYEYSTDRGLPNKLKDVTAGSDLVNNVMYSPAGQLTWLYVVGSGGEGRSYNDNGQLTGLTMPGRSITYYYPSPGSNNGQITTMVESGESITYQYDSLKRLTSATSSASWSQTYSYDGFGNMYNKAGTGGAPSWSSSISASTNRLTSVSYDANGNQLSAAMTAGMPDTFNLSYDVMNRLTTAVNPASTRTSEYEYDPGNKRVYEKRTVGASSTEWVHFFGISGQNLGRYQFLISGATITFYQIDTSVWFGSRLVGVPQDRLGSVGKYLPYGEDKPGASNPADDNVKFATYTRDGGTGLDYADQRWHGQGTGRFLTSDPYHASGGATRPGSWNRYGYAEGDSIRNNDPSGRAACNYAGRWTYMEETNFTVHDVLDVHCTSDAGTVWDHAFFDFPNAAHSGDIQGAFDLMANHVNATEVSNFQYTIDFARRGLMNLSNECLDAVGGSRTAFEDRLWFGSSGFSNFGPLTVFETPDTNVLTPVANGQGNWPVARFYSAGSGTIQFNRLINWSFPDQTLVVTQDGRITTMDLPAGMAARVGTTSMTNVQFIQLVLLHELAHSFGKTHPTGVSDEYDKTLWKKCF